MTRWSFPTAAITWRCSMPSTMLRFLDVELAASRDGEHFVHVKRGQKVIPLGSAGAWDWQQILQTPAIGAHDKLWLFYGGQTMPAELLAAGRNEQRVAGRRRRPGHAPPRRLHAPGCGRRAKDRLDHDSAVEITRTSRSRWSSTRRASRTPGSRSKCWMRETGQPLPGFSRDDCQPLAEDR